jgi:hypothetical protein
MSESRFTVVFAGDIRSLAGNPHKIESPFGTVQSIDASDVMANNDALRAEVERLRAYALKTFTVVEFCSGEGFMLEEPYYDCDDLLMEGVELLKVETSEEARAALARPAERMS